MKSAFVIKKGAYEKLVCLGCAVNRLVMAGAFLWREIGFTPVTLSCEAHCSICDDTIV
jgi:hypothetical protein